jgi:hypothetical protein
MNSNGFIVTSARTTTHSQPISVTPQDIIAVPLDISKPSWAKISFSFSRRADIEPKIFGPIDLVYAVSDLPPTDLENYQSTFGYVNFSNV